MSAKPILYSKTTAENFRVDMPRQNEKKTKSMSAFALRDTRVQLGSRLDPTNMSCVLNKVLLSPTRALALKLVDTSVLAWLCDFETSMVAQLQRNCRAWFDRDMDMVQAGRMIASILRRDVVTVKCAKYVDVYKLDQQQKACQRMELVDVPLGSYCTPVLRFDGLFIAKHHFSCSFTATAILVGDVPLSADESSSEALSQFVQEVREDIRDPQQYMSDEASGKSFDTMVHDEYMSSFDV
ncbi:MAG: hypothetical protein CL454_00030 [Acidimicrobiaceae bacterium]|nr:hypothetical protein [Acidimicrobiaceae bacterium]|tara:strand:- start:810 stop:1526 length:717 start_codon:yes stop_codon:yes gene_type:complete